MYMSLIHLTRDNEALQHHQSNTVVEQSTMEEEIVAITFCNGEDGKDEISVMIEDPLDLDSTMMDVMAHDDVLRSYGYHGYEALRYHIKRKSGKVLSVKSNRFDTLKVKKLLRLKNVDEDYCAIVLQE